MNFKKFRFVVKRNIKFSLKIMFSGTICSCLGFPFIFIPCWFCVGVPDWAQFIYYVPLIVIFQFGWACAQIGHLALIPEMTFSTSEKVQLNGWR